MRREDYLSDPDVAAFVAWLRPSLCESGAFNHSWSDGEGVWACTSIFDAYRGYRWRGASFSQTGAELLGLGVQLQAAYRDGDKVAFLRAATAVMRWGGVMRMKWRLDLDVWWESLPDILRRLAPNSADTEDLLGIPMNSAYTKVYALMLPGFPMYDGRVAAGLGHFVRLFLLDSDRHGYPPLTLDFSRSGEPRRNPSGNGVRLRSFALGDDREVRRARSNLMSAWLFSVISQIDCFGELPEGRRIRAIEAALFMIGYELPTPATPRM